MNEGFRLQSPQPMSARRKPVSPRYRGPKYSPPSQSAIKLLTAGELLGGLRPVSHGALQLIDVALQTPLWCAGNIQLLQRKAVAIVGTRDATAEGAARARRLAKELAHAGVVVVSGLAKGVDTAALSAAIEAGGKVAAVIGTPLDQAYPAENKLLQEQIYQEHLLISQFAPAGRVFPSHFPERNRMMAMLTDASVIIEAGETSGTIHQATECVRLGRWLFIARNVMEDPSLAWPAHFKHYNSVRTLSHTSDILAVLRA